MIEEMQAQAELDAIRVELQEAGLLLAGGDDETTEGGW